MELASIRKTVYLSATKDRDIIEHIMPKLEKYSFSSIIKELVREGMSHRKKGLYQDNACSQPVETVVHREPDLKKFELESKDVTDTDLEDRLDRF